MRRAMVPKVCFAAAIGAVFFLTGTSSFAEEYRPDEFLTLDLSKAVLSPKPLGPPAQFEPIRVQARTDFESRTVKAERVHVDPVPRHVNAMRKTAARTKIVQVRPEPARVPPRTKLVRRHGNPLDAQASDTRIQVWPCKSGGICNWQRTAQ